MKYFETFAGVGGFSQAMPDHFECVGMSEIDKYASAVLKYKYPTIRNYGDITKINWKTVPDFDILVGGSPCQDLSVAGKQAGLNGSRSGLFSVYVRALHEKQPDHFIWENVKGALSSNGGRDFATILNAFSEAGYSLWWQVLNAKDFGVPQNRERVFVVGTRIGSPREILFERTADKNTVVSNTIRTGGKGSLSKKHAWDLVQINNPKRSRDRVYSQDGIAPTIDTGQGGGRQPFISVPVLTPDRINKRQNGRRFKTDGEEMFTLNTQDRHGVFDGIQIRRLTPLECERLMSWPDNWTKYGIMDGEKVAISDTQRYKMCGNGVVSEVVRQVIEQHIL